MSICVNTEKVILRQVQKHFILTPLNQNSICTNYITPDGHLSLRKETMLSANTHPGAINGVLRDFTAFSLFAYGYLSL